MTELPDTPPRREPVDQFNERTARRALTAACQQVGLFADAVELIRVGSNAVFRLSPDVVARVAPSTGLLANAVTQIDVARWLESVGLPAVRAVDVRQPVAADGRVVTFWMSVALETVYAPIAEVARLIRELHKLPKPDDLELPTLRPFGGAADPVPEFPGLDAEDANLLKSHYMRARESFSDLPFVLPHGVIHGDANVGNVLVDEQGQAVLIDLDGFSLGPREWDLIQTALFADRLGWHTPEEYRTFVEVYGYDITQWSGYEALADMREIAMTTWLSKKAGESEKTAREAARRIEAIRTGGSRKDWGAY